MFLPNLPLDIGKFFLTSHITLSVILAYFQSIIVCTPAPFLLGQGGGAVEPLTKFLKRGVAGKDEGDFFQEGGWGGGGGGGNLQF